MLIMEICKAAAYEDPSEKITGEIAETDFSVIKFQMWSREF